MTTAEKLGTLGRAVLLIAVLVFVAMAVHGGRHPLKVGNPAPELHLLSYDGKAWDLSRFEGKPLVVNFWGTWCPPCLQELPHFASASRRYKDDVVFIGAAVKSPPDEVFGVIRRFGIEYPVAAVDGNASARWEARTLPSTYVLNDKHELVWSISGAITSAEIDAVLADKLGISRPPG
jgi:thiol-disulfide isomerase/thioredoxin